MRKQAAIDLFDGGVAAAARALGVTYQAVDKWPDPLPRRIVDRVVAACVYEGIVIPGEFLESLKSSRLCAAQQGNAATCAAVDGEHLPLHQ